MILSKEAEFDVLGLRVKSKPEADEGKITTKEIVDLVNREALKLKAKSGFTHSSIRWWLLPC